MEVWIGVLVVLNLLQAGGLVGLLAAHLYQAGELRALNRRVDRMTASEQIETALEYNTLRTTRTRSDVTVEVTNTQGGATSIGGNAQSGGAQFQGQTNVNAPLAGGDQTITEPRKPDPPRPPGTAKLP